MEWLGDLYMGLVGLVLVLFPRMLIRGGGAASEARLTRGYQEAGKALLHLAVFFALLKAVGRR